MKQQEAKVRITKLKHEIDRYRYHYHVLDQSLVSDGALDSLKNELVNLEVDFPKLVTQDSPTQRVGGRALNKFKKIQHDKPMLSINDAFSEIDIQSWRERLQKLLPGKKWDYFVEVKIDGLAMSLIYSNGSLDRAVTRGDGKIGELVTQNIKTIDSIPLRLNDWSIVKNFLPKIIGHVKIKNLENKVKKIMNGNFEIRGEVYMSRKVFEKLNKKCVQAKKDTFANPRNAAAGAVRQLDPGVVVERELSFILYDIKTDFGQLTHEEIHCVGKLLGFKVAKHVGVCNSLADVFSFYKKVAGLRECLPYWIDGLVVNVNQVDVFKKLGIVGKAPRASIAYKYPAEQATTIVQDIQVQIGRTGALTPVAHLKPVKVAGTTVSRATLHNLDEINRLGVKVGDTVIIQKAGDIIPDIVKVLVELRTGKETVFKMPEKCPLCESEIIKRENEVAYYCSNKKCFAIQRREIYHFVSKKAFDIDGLGPKVVDQLLEKGLIENTADLFTLNKGDLEVMERFAEKSAENLVKSISESRQIELGRFIYALGIRHIGEETAYDLAKQISREFSSVVIDENNVKKFIDFVQNKEVEDWAKMFDVGGVMAQSIVDWFAEEGNIELIGNLFENGVVASNKQFELNNNKFFGRSFVLTGSLNSMTRDNAKKKIRDLGGEISSSVSNNIDYVIAGENSGSKYDKAKKIKIKIINEKEFLIMIK